MPRNRPRSEAPRGERSAGRLGDLPPPPGSVGHLPASGGLTPLAKPDKRQWATFSTLSTSRMKGSSRKEQEGAEGMT